MSAWHDRNFSGFCDPLPGRTQRHCDQKCSHCSRSTSSVSVADPTGEKLADSFAFWLRRLQFYHWSRLVGFCALVFQQYKEINSVQREGRWCNMKCLKPTGCHWFWLSAFPALKKLWTVPIFCGRTKRLINSEGNILSFKNYFVDCTLQPISLGWSTNSGDGRCI